MFNSAVGERTSEQICWHIRVYNVTGTQLTTLIAYVLFLVLYCSRSPGAHERRLSKVGPDLHALNLSTQVHVVGAPTKAQTGWATDFVILLVSSSSSNQVPHEPLPGGEHILSIPWSQSFTDFLGVQ